MILSKQEIDDLIKIAFIGLKKAVYIRVDTANMDYAEFEAHALSDKCLSKPLRAPFKAFTLDMTASPVYLDFGIKLLAVDVINMREVMENGIDNSLYVACIMFERENGEKDISYTVLSKDSRDAVREMNFATSNGDHHCEWATVYSSVFVDYFCDKMSGSSRWWGDTAKAMKKAGGSKKNKSSHTHSGGSLNVFVPRSKPNPENRRDSERKELKEITEEIVVRGGYPHVYWIKPENHKEYMGKYERLNREAIFCPHVLNEKGKMAMVLIMEPFTRGGKEKKGRHERRVK